MIFFFFFFVNLIYRAKIEIYVTRTKRCVVYERDGGSIVTVQKLAGTLATGLCRWGYVRGIRGFRTATLG